MYTLLHLCAAEAKVLDQLYSDACATQKTLEVKKSQLVKHTHMLTVSDSDPPPPHLSTSSNTTLPLDTSTELQSRERSSVPSTKGIIPIVHTATGSVDSTGGCMLSGVYNGQVRQITPLQSRDDVILTTSYNGAGSCSRQAAEHLNLSTSSSRFRCICTAWKHVPDILRPCSNNCLSHSESRPLSLETMCVKRVSSPSCSISNLCGNSKKLVSNRMAGPSPLNSTSLRHTSNSLSDCLAVIDSMYCEMTKKLSHDVVLKRPWWLKSKLNLSFKVPVMHDRSQRIQSELAQTSSRSETEKCDETIVYIETSHCQSSVETVHLRACEDLAVTEILPAFACSEKMSAAESAQCHFTSSDSQSRDRRHSDRMTESRGSSAFSPEASEVDTERTFANKSPCRYELRKRTPVKDHRSLSHTKSVKKVQNSLSEDNAASHLQNKSCLVTGGTTSEVAAFPTCVIQETPLLLPTDSGRFDSKTDDDDDVLSVSSDCSGIVPYAKHLQFGLNPVLAEPKTRTSPPQKITKKRNYSSGKSSASTGAANSPRSGGKTKVSAEGRNRISPCIDTRYVSKKQKSANLSKKSVSSRGSISNKKQSSCSLKRKKPLSDNNVSNDLHQTESTVPAKREKMAIKKNKEKGKTGVLVHNNSKAQDQTKAIIKKLASKMSAAARNSARNVAQTMKGRKKSSKIKNETPSELSHFKKKRNSDSSVARQPKKRRLENGNQKVVTSVNERLSKQSAIVSHHEHLSTKTASCSVLTLTEKDMFSQLCRLEERAKVYDDSVMHSLIPLTEKSPELNIYRKPVARPYSASNAHVGGIWKSIFSER